MARQQGYGAGQKRMDARGNAKQGGGCLSMIATMLVGIASFFAVTNTVEAAPELYTFNKYNVVGVLTLGTLNASTSIAGVLVLDTTAQEEIVLTVNGVVYQGKHLEVKVSSGDTLTISATASPIQATARVTLPYKTFLSFICR